MAAEATWEDELSSIDYLSVTGDQKSRQQLTWGFTRPHSFGTDSKWQYLSLKCQPSSPPNPQGAREEETSEFRAL